jgi:signal peptidase II
LPREAGKEEALKRVLPWVLIPGSFLLDRAVKAAAERSLSPHETVPVWDGVFHLTLVHNTGAAFGMWKNASEGLAVFSALSALFIIGYIARGGREGVPHASAWALIAGGALGNLYDRVVYGHVVDYLDFRVWPVFNLADAFITCGVAWIFWKYASRSV